MSGLSGTQIPGYSYDWAQSMKYIDFLAYYNGVQTKVVHDFAAPGVRFRSMGRRLHACPHDP